MYTTRPSAMGQLGGACARQWTAIASDVEALTDAELVVPSGLAGWRTAELVAQLAGCLECVVEWSALPAPSRAQLTAAQYLLDVPSMAVRIDTRERAMASASFLAGLRSRMRHAVDAFTGLLDVADPARLIASTVGAIRLDELLVTRCVEGVVHGMDFASPREPDREALKISVKVLLAALAVRAPGKSVEVRVPPFGAVQAVQGIRHTRGTPPNVVETDPLTWVRLAAGRLGWAAAIDTGAVRASGDRSDISGLLPLL